MIKQNIKKISLPFSQLKLNSDGMIPFQTERDHDYFVKQGWIEKGD